jgi:hypothetical protein
MFDFSNTFVAVAPSGPGVFKVEIVTTEQTQTKRGSDRVRLQARIIGSVEAGDAENNCTIRDGFNRPNSGDSRMDDMMARMWMQFFISVGYSQDDIREKSCNFDNVNDSGAFEYLIGRTGYVKYAPADPENGRQYQNTTWLTEDQYNAAKSARSEVSAAQSTFGDSVEKILEMD